MTGLQSTSPDVVKASLNGMRDFMVSITDKDEVIQLQALIGPVLAATTNLLNAGDEDLVTDGIEVLQEASGIEKPIINDSIDQVVLLVVNILEHESIDPSIQQSAGSCLMSIIENRPKLIAKKGMVAPIVQTMVKIISKSDAPAAGSLYTMATDKKGDEESYDDDEGPAEIAQTCLDLMACNVGAKYFAQPALSICAECFQSPDPKIRKAGGSVLGLISEGCNDALKPILSQIVPQLMPLVRDSDKNVREAATFASGQLAEHCQPDILYHHEIFMSTMLAAMEDPAHTVQGTACYVIEFFCENLDQEILKRYLQPLLERLGALLSLTDVTTLDMALAAIAATAVAAELDFLPFAHQICTHLDSLIFLTEPTQFQVRGRALECLGHIALGIGSDNFCQQPYFTFFERGMQSIAQAEQLQDDSLREFSYVFISNCAKAMGGVFVDRLQTLVPILLGVVQASELSKADGDDDDDDEYVPQGGDDSDDEDNVYVNIEDGFVNTKKAAVGALGALAEHCGSSYEGFFAHTFTTMIREETGAVWSYHKSIRAEAVTTLPQLCSVLCSKYNLSPPPKGQQLELPEDLKTALRATMACYLKIIDDDYEKEVVGNVCDSISDLLKKVGVSLLTLPADDGRSFADLLMADILKLLQDKAQCQTKLEENEDEDDDENHDNQLMDRVCDLIGEVAKAAGPMIVPFFETFYQCLLKFCKPSRAYTDKAMAVGCIATVLDAIDEHGSKFISGFLPIVLEGLTDATEDVRRNSAYSMGILIRIGKESLQPNYQQILEVLNPICLRDCAAESGSMISGGADADNAVYAASHMVLQAANLLPLADVLNMILSALPLKNDFDEAGVVYNCVCGLVNQGNPATTNLLPQIFTVYAKSLIQSKLGNTVKKEIVDSIKLMASSKAQVFAATLQALPSELQNVINQALSMP